MRETIAQQAAKYMDGKGFESVGCGDTGLLHEIAEACGIPHRSVRTEKQILDALDRSAGLFIKEFYSLPERGRGKLRNFRRLVP